VVFPEGHDSRTLRAVALLMERGIVRPVVIGKRAALLQVANEAGISLPSARRVIEPTTFERLDEFAETFYELRKHKGISRAQARQRQARQRHQSARSHCLGAPNGPDLLVDGELQFDAAYVEHIRKRKTPDSPVAGRANLFIFPNLDGGNIAYKIAERLGGAQAIAQLFRG